MTPENITIISVSVIILIALIVFLVYWFVFRKKNKANAQLASQFESVNQSKPKQDTESKLVPLEIKLTAIKREKGSGIGGYETLEEATARLSKITDYNEFRNLNVIERPYSKEQWNKLSAEGKYEDIDKRNKEEQGLLFRYLPNGKEVPQHAKILTRVFEVPENVKM